MHMRALNRQSGHRSRELRRRVLLPARLRLGSEWADACILNVSSRGMMIQTGRAAKDGALVEIRRDRHVIIARVMWQSGGKVGLRSEDRLPVEEILSLGTTKNLRLVAADGAIVERRRKTRDEAARSRLQGRTMQFAGVLAIGLAMALSGLLWVRQTFAQPLAAAEAALEPRR